MKKTIVFYLGIIIMVGACYPQGPEYYEDLDLVYTNYDDQYNIASTGTYGMGGQSTPRTENMIRCLLLNLFTS